MYIKLHEKINNNYILWPGFWPFHTLFNPWPIFRLSTRKILLATPPIGTNFLLVPQSVSFATSVTSTQFFPPPSPAFLLPPAVSNCPAFLLPPVVSNCPAFLLPPAVSNCPAFLPPPAVSNCPTFLLPPAVSYCTINCWRSKLKRKLPVSLGFYCSLYFMHVLSYAYLLLLLN